MTTQLMPRRLMPVAKFAFAVQMFLLRRNWMGAAGNIIMVITTTGRKSGKPHSTPIGYLRDGETVLAFTMKRSNSNWFKNVLHTPTVTLTIKGQTMPACGELITDEAEITRVIDLYLREQASLTQRFWGLAPDASAEERQQARERVRFIRFRPVR